jgi:hypothetical protein
MTLVKSAPKKIFPPKKQYEKTDLLIPHSTYSKKKSFHLLEGTMLRAEKGQKWKKPLEILKNGFL